MMDINIRLGVLLRQIKATLKQRLITETTL